MRYGLKMILSMGDTRRRHLTNRFCRISKPI